MSVCNLFNQDLTRSDSESTYSVTSIHFPDDGDTPDADADSTLPYVEEDIECGPSVELPTKRLYVILFGQRPQRADVL